MFNSNEQGAMMNDKLQAALAEILKTLQSGAEAVANGARAELPQLVKEYLAWGMAQAALGVLFGFVLIGLAWELARWIRAQPAARCMSDYCGERPCPHGHVTGPQALGAVVRYGALLLGAIPIVQGVYIAAQIAIAPRVFLLEQVSQLAGLK